MNKLFAHFYNGPRGTFQLLITRDNACIQAGVETTFTVAGKREARKIANAIGAVCWNF